MFRVLIDTHVLLWTLTDDNRANGRIRSILDDPEHQIYVSAVSIWEVAIKHIKHPMLMPMEPEVAMQGALDSGFLLLDMSAMHAAESAQIPALHGDPFDRILIAQARTEPMHFLTCDAALKVYSHLVSLL